MDNKNLNEKGWKAHFASLARLYNGPFGSFSDKYGRSWLIINTYYLCLSVCVGAGVLFVAHRFSTRWNSDVAFIAALFVIWMSLLIVWQLTINSRLSHSTRQQSWLINAVNWNVERLRAHGLSSLPKDPAQAEGNVGVSHWPWGRHHTELLGHLEAAARRFWTLYDPDDPSTAPTNNIVSDWLHEERGVSKDKAKAIASILRADGLATGPR